MFLPFTRIRSDKRYGYGRGSVKELSRQRFKPNCLTEVVPVADDFENKICWRTKPLPSADPQLAQLPYMVLRKLAQRRKPWTRRKPAGSSLKEEILESCDPAFCTYPCAVKKVGRGNLVFKS